MNRPTLEELLADLAPHTATCRREGCENQDQSIVVLTSATSPSAACGACALDGENSPIADLTPTEE